MTQSNAYAQAGVDVDIEAMASRIMFDASKMTHANRDNAFGSIIQLFDDFSGARFFDISNQPFGTVASLGSDGAGTKVLAYQMGSTYRGVAHDLIAMLADDVVVHGGEPVLITNVLDVRSLGTDTRHLPKMRELAEGLVSAANAANVAVINGEIAQMGVCISGHGDFPFNWSGTCFWVAKRDRVLSGREIKVGDSIIALRERGTRANGLSLLRATLEKAYGPDWHEYVFNGIPFADHLNVPSTIYARLMVRLNGGYSAEPTARVNGFVHVTGGGIPEKLGRLLRKSGLGAEISELWSPPEVVKQCQLVGNISDYDAYKALGMGTGGLVVTPEPDVVLQTSHDMGFEPILAGKITQKSGISIISQGVKTSGALLEF